MEIFCFVAGVMCVYFKTIKPVFVPIAILFLRFRLAVGIAFFLGVFLACMHEWVCAEKGMPNGPIIKKTNISGIIHSIPVQNKQKTQFELQLQSINGKMARANILLSCSQNCPKFHVGEKWNFEVKLKRPRNYHNPGSFNYKRFLNARHISWTGYVINHQLIEPTHRFLITQWRAKMAEQLSRIIPDRQVLGVVQALTLGIAHSIDKTEWELFRQTGTIHLMVISGAHIGLVAGMIYWLAFNVWRFAGRLCLVMPAQKFASLCSLLAATLYALFAGFGVPAERALIVCFLMLLRYFINKPYTVWQAWRYALLIVVIYEPHSILMPGFYLSFIAVAILLLVSQTTHIKGLRKMFLIQFICMLGLLPFTLYLFSYGAVNGVLANLIAVPIVGFIIIPLSMLVLFINFFIHTPILIDLLSVLVQWTLGFLRWVDVISIINLKFSLQSLNQVIIISLALFIILLVPVRQLKVIVVLILLPAMKPSEHVLKGGELVVDVLDVGQGLAVVVRTSGHTIIYDTGIQFYKGSNMGEMVIKPYLDYLGIHRIDKIIVSHSDLDHRGGLDFLRKSLHIDELLFENPDFYKTGNNCHDYPTWQYDDVHFKFLSMDLNVKGKNNHSCILKITSKSGSILLTGDVEKKGEKYLVKNHLNALQSDVLLIPHHSSKSSSTPLFVKAVSPKYAISSFGIDNRYGFPHQKTIETFNEYEIPVYDTATHGMIRVSFKKSHIQVNTHLAST